MQTPEKECNFVTMRILLPHIAHRGRLLAFCVASSASVAFAGTDGADLHRLMSPYESEDSTEVRTLHLNVGALAFFKDNEYDGNISKGYSLPGVWLVPRVSYRPRPELKFELGASALMFHGANKYPNFAFHDIVTWKGSEYQSGAHLLPYFRAEAQLGAATFVLGDLHGGAAHALSLPLYKPENLLTTDPEKGWQVLLRTPRWNMDAWIDWQSFIYETDKHQEAFTVGMTQSVRLTRPTSSRFSLSLPLQLMVQHRGGEQDATDLGVQTISNAAIGLQARQTFGNRTLNAAELEVFGLGAYQQAGKLWPFNAGAAFWAAGRLELLRSLRVTVGFFQAQDFVSLYGSPFFNTVSLKNEGGRFSHMTTGYWNVEYCHSFCNDYVFGAKADGYLTDAGRLSLRDGTSEPPALRHAFSFGVYLRARMDFLLKRFK